MCSWREPRSSAAAKVGAAGLERVPELQLMARSLKSQLPPPLLPAKRHLSAPGLWELYFPAFLPRAPAAQPQIQPPSSPGSITHGSIDPQTCHCGWRCHGRIPNLLLCLQSVTSHPLLPNTVSNSLLAEEQPVPCQNTQGATVPAGMPAAADSALACLLPSLPVLGDSSPRVSAAPAR